LCYDVRFPWLSGGGSVSLVSVLLIVIIYNKAMVYLRTHEFLISEVGMDLRRLM